MMADQRNKHETNPLFSEPFEVHSHLFHTIMICPKEEYEAFVRGDLVWNESDGTFADPKDLDEFWPEDYIPYQVVRETLDQGYFEREYTTSSGERIVAFGYFGYDFFGIFGN